MASLDSGYRPVGRPRDHNLDLLIRAATIELLAEGGEVAASLDDVAARARVGKATIYRRWPTKRELIENATAGDLPIELPALDRGSLADDARALLAAVVALLATPQALAARQLLIQLPTWPELADTYRDGVLAPWQAAVQAVATRAHARGEISDPAPAKLALEAAAARICLPWMARPETVTGADSTVGEQRVEDLVATLVAPLTRT